MEDYTNLVNARIEKEVLNAYKTTPEFQTASDNLKNTLPPMAKFNEYLNSCVELGVGAEYALECYVLTLKMQQ